MTVTLEDALASGQGIERPFSCPDPKHEDKNASASVNVLKGVWVCYACHAKGSAGSAKAPSVDSLMQMLEPEKVARVYPEDYLRVFDIEGQRAYWHDRFPDYLVWAAGLGEDPITGHATFPVRTPRGTLAGVGRRVRDEDVAQAKEDGTNASRYKYPAKWAASGSLPCLVRPNVVVLVEGYADACSLWEIGVPAAPVFGSALHFPQVELLLRMRPDHVVLGMDDDEAGHRGRAISLSALSRTALDVSTMTWHYAKDPAACTPEQRRRRLVSVVGEQYLPKWEEAASDMKAAYQRHQENQ